MSDGATVDIQRIEKVLLADGWHAVRRGTFRVGEFALVGPDKKVVGYTPGLQYGAQWEQRDDSSREAPWVVTCPLSAILALQSD